MKIKTITVKFGRTVNTRNYNSERYDAEITAQLEDGESHEDVFSVLRAFARDEIANQVAYRAEMRKVDQYLAGRPSSDSLTKAIERIAVSKILSERDKEIYTEEMLTRLGQSLGDKDEDEKLEMKGEE